MLRGFAMAADLLLLNICLLFAKRPVAAFVGGGSSDYPLSFFSWNFAYFVCLVFLPPTIGRRSLQSNDIARNCFSSGLVMVALHYVIIGFCGKAFPPWWQMLAVCAVVPTWMFCSRIFSRALVRAFGSRRRVFFVGHSDTLKDLIVTMRADITSRYEMCGHFSAAREALDWLARNACDEIYCATGGVDENSLLALFDYCENHLVRFYGVPDSRWMLDRHMVVEMDGDTPIFTPRLEPLNRLSSRIVKRTFDVVFSTFVLAFLFPPVWLIAAIMIKRQSPGPVFFIQWRDGLDGRRFRCIKFRSMSADGNTDGRAATKDDPRKFPFGDFMRRNNIDELPQFVNVLLGDMSVVGPRPHAIWTTDEYRDIVNKYMVRLYVKPGITGWAQVNGYRGETKTKADMAGRVRLDVWYVSHWSIWLDLRTIVKTITNMLGGERGNVY